MSKNVIFRWSLVAGLAGFIFGFDTVVISGANLPLKSLWHTTPFFHGFFIMSMALWGTLLGSIFGGYPADKLGRKKTLFWIGILFALSAIGSAIANDPYTFSLFRFIGGIGIGASTVAAPIYISEISTANQRGKLVALYQFNIVFGILIAYLSNYAFDGFDGLNDWRWMLGIMFLPSIVFIFLIIGIPESPRWLITKKNDFIAAKNILIRMGIVNINNEIDLIVKANEKNQLVSITNKFFTNKNKKIIWLAFFIAFFNQFSGINFVLYYAPEIFSRIGMSSKDSLFNSVLLGCDILVFTLLGLYLIDKIGRKKLLLIGSIGYIISLTMIAGCFYGNLNSTLLLFFLLLFIASHSIGQGTVIWVFIAEIFPNSLRATGQSFGASIHWGCAALITLFTPFFFDKKDGLFNANPWFIFCFFSIMMIFQFIWVVNRVSETKGISLEDLESKFVKNNI
jgi:sugar porter (SP) family MFS transporter